jgi:hypothetical protein
MRGADYRDEGLKTGTGNTADGQTTGQTTGQTNTGNGDKGNSDGGGNTGKVTFTPEQQTKIQQLIDEASGRAYAKALKDSEARRTKAPEDTNGDKDTSLKDAEMERLRKQVDAMRAVSSRNALLTAISKHNVIDASEIAALTERYVRHNDDGTLSVINEAGQARLNAEGRDMSIEEMVAEYLRARPHHLRASGTAGAGSAGVGFGGIADSHKPLTPEVVRSMSGDELRAALKDGVVVHGSAGQTFKFKNVSNPFAAARQKVYKKGA